MSNLKALADNKSNDAEKYIFSCNLTFKCWPGLPYELPCDIIRPHVLRNGNKESPAEVGSRILKELEHPTSYDLHLVR